MEQEHLKRIVEALVFASDSPLSITQIRDCIENVSEDDLVGVLQQLESEWSNSNRAFFIKKVGGGFQFTTKPEYYKWLKRFFEGRVLTRLTRAALETLAIIAYKQPITKVEVSSIRGVNSDGVVKGLLSRKFITLLGRARGPGRPLLYGTTPEFLRYFGLNELSDLPKLKEIDELFADGDGATILSDITESQSDRELRRIERDRERRSPKEDVLTQTEMNLESDAGDSDENPDVNPSE